MNLVQGRGLFSVEEFEGAQCWWWKSGNRNRQRHNGCLWVLVAHCAGSAKALGLRYSHCPRLQRWGHEVTCSRSCSYWVTLTSYCVTLDLNLGSPAPESFLLPLPSVALERGSLSQSSGRQRGGGVFWLRIWTPVLLNGAKRKRIHVDAGMFEGSVAGNRNSGLMVPFPWSNAVFFLCFLFFDIHTHN